MKGWVPSGVEYIADILSRSEGTFFVYGDPDVDGLFSTQFVLLLLKSFNKDYEVFINENRAHGFFYEDIKSLSGRTVIAVDFSITPDKLKLLQENNVKLINIDHHEILNKEQVTYSCDGTHVDGVVVNNQYCFEPEEHRYLSGAGVVYYAFCALVAGFDTELTRALVGLTLLSDIRPLENPYAREFLKTCYKCRHPYILRLVELTRAEKDYNFGVPSMERNYIDYTFSPKINALFRLNLGNVALDIIQGKDPPFSLSDARDVQNQVCDYIYSNLKNPFDINGLLNTAEEGIVQVPKFVDNGLGGQTKLVSTALDGLTMCFVEDTPITNATYKLSNFIGLTCSHLKGTGNSTVVYVGTADVIVRGSFRGRCDTVNYLQLFRKYGMTCAGHENAFGILNCRLADVDFIGLIKELKQLEAIAIEQEYANRITETSNFAMFTRTQLLKDIALTNIYVRDRYRVYIKYTGTNIVRKTMGKMWEYTIDGVHVKCFDADINPSNGYILPIYDRGILSFYLKNIKK